MENTEKELQHSDLQPVLIYGKHRNDPVPDTLYGLISALLLRSEQMGADISEELDRIGLSFPQRSYYLIYVSVDDSTLNLQPGQLRHTRRLELYDRFRTLFTDRLDPALSGISILMLGHMILGFFTEDLDLLTGIARDVMDQLRKEQLVRMHVTFSAPADSLQRIEKCFRMTQDLEMSRQFYGETIPDLYVISDASIQRISDKEQMTSFENGFFQAAERICGCVTALDTAAAGALIEQELRRIAENCIGFPYPTSRNVTVNRFLSLLQYRLTDQGLADWRFLARQDFSRQLVECQTLDAYCAIGHEIAKQLVAHHRKRTADRHDSLMGDIHAFIEENATDMNMGLSAIAKEFRIKPREAAESFRQYFGESVNDVMHRARVKKARELLLTTDTPVQEIAEQVGYCSLATMYRAFTKFEGVAPGKLRQTTDKDEA